MVARIALTGRPSSTGSLDAYAAGELPDWALIGPARRAHAGRVAALLGEWAHRLGLDAADVTRWRAAGWLHDALRDAEADALRAEASPPFDSLPDAYLHGPVTADRLAADGIDDAELLDAIRYHTLGRAGLGLLGRALIAADYLEPGRHADPVWRATRRARMPADFDDVVRDVAAAKLRGSADAGTPVRTSFAGFWNSLIAPDDVCPL